MSSNLARIFKSRSFNFQFQKNLNNNLTIYEKVKSSWRRASKALTQIEETTKGNNVTMFFTGDEMFSEMWNKIRNAKETVLVETYTIEPDIIGNRTIELLKEAQERGVKVSFAYDAIGSSSLSDFDIYEMKIKGAEIFQFNPIKLVPNLPYTLRNHRKIMVIDSKYGFCGGMNISGKYASSSFEGGKDYFRDTHCMIEGPAVEKLSEVFYNSIKDRSKKTNQVTSYFKSIHGYPVGSYIKSGAVGAALNAYDELEGSQNKEKSTNELENIYQSRNASISDLDSNYNYIEYSNLYDDEDESSFDTSLYSLANIEKSQIEKQKMDQLDLTEDDYDIDDDDFKEFVTFTNDFQSLHNLNNLNNYILDDSNLGNLEKLNNMDSKANTGNPNPPPNSIFPLIKSVGSNPFNSKPNKIIMASVKVENTVVQVQESNQFRKKRDIQKSLIISLNGARERCYITTPYFLPPIRLRRAIISAALRGVDVRIITAGKSDVPWFRHASRHIYQKFLKHDKIRIYEMLSSTLHAKTLSIDGVYGTIGSFNLDTWSKKNLEANIAFLSPQLVNILEQQFKNDLVGCKEITLKDVNNRSLLDKLICYLCYQLSKILKP
ncbi:hypothetical protein DICPUDRAFT_147466 [Dictyostelium purpureum]|uniref:PLD phosphodiesterase domain-containing protein n=1 Tax=Dictyostelium purpureum TaxID=5786 RepID=F0Z8J7_DICPU|nr:uncharacterized protein DICPUDRAFT_147466 [Dictyostelium purpureum]EGC39773.1 hypothetical protein DICPUDRAFT_147466 [Dictyostelium purpureum]|eukprot:XP_003283759.1 hypothetical protein DICPUDRAFT_147466 [Dictyostelium purpureum]